MSAQNLAAVRRALDAWNRRDLDGALDAMHPECEVDWTESRGLHRGVFRGPEQVRGFYEDWLEMFDELDIRAEDLIDAGEHVVVPNLGVAQGREGVAVAANAYWRSYPHREDALSDLG